MLFASVSTVIVYFVPAVRFAVGVHVTSFSVISQTNVPVIGGTEEIAPCVADAFIASEKMILMPLLREMFLVLLTGSVVVTVGGLSPVVKEKIYGATMFMSSWLLAFVLIVIVYLVLGERFVFGSQVTFLDGISHVNDPEIVGEAEIAVCVADLFMISEKLSMILE